MSGTSVEVFDLLERIWRHRQVLVLWGFITGGMALGAAQLFPPRFTSEGLLLIDNQQPQIFDLGSTPAPAQPPNNKDHTIADVLRSRALVTDVVKSLSLTRDSGIIPRLRVPSPLVPILADVQSELQVLAKEIGLTSSPLDEEHLHASEIEDVVSYLQKHFKIEMADGSRMVSISLEASVPALAADVVNGLMDRYIGGDLSQKGEMITQANRWLSQRVLQVRKELDEAERKVQDFRRTHNVLNVEAGSLPAVQLAADEAQLSFARNDYAKLSASLATLQDQLKSGGDGTGTQEVMSSPIIQSLRQRETELYQRLDLSAQHLGSVNIDRQAVGEELRTVHKRIAAETQAIVQSLTREVSVARDRVDALQQRVTASGALANDAADAEVTLAGLQRDVDVKRQIYNGLVMRADQTQPATSLFSSVRILSRAVPAPRPEPSHIVQVVLFAIVGGILLGAAVQLLRVRLDSRIRSVLDLAAATGLPVLGSIPLVKLRLDESVIADGSSLVAETLRAFRVNISWKAVANRGTTVMVTSSTIGEGKTTIATSLARRFAADGMKVLLIEADLRRPRLASMLHLSSDKNIENLLTDGITLETAVQIDGESGLHCLVASGKAANPLGLLTSDAFEMLIARARQSYHVIILDSPPVLRVADPIVLARLVDMTLFVVRSNLTTLALIREALRRLPEAQRSNITMALNQVRKKQSDQRDFYSGYSDPSRPFKLPRIEGSNSRVVPMHTEL